MESSCATSTSCAAALALPPFPISGPLTATSFLPAPNGNSWVFDLQGRCNIHRQRQSQLELYDFEPRRNTFRAEVLQGLQDARKELPSKYFYDDAGSCLFEQICALDEYYPTRTELAIMQAHKQEMATLLGPQCLLIEYGSGSSTKVCLLLDALQEPAGYVPIDIAKEPLLRSVAALVGAYPGLEVLPVCADYTSDFE